MLLPLELSLLLILDLFLGLNHPLTAPLTPSAAAAGGGGNVAGAAGGERAEAEEKTGTAAVVEAEEEAEEEAGGVPRGGGGRIDGGWCDDTGTTAVKADLLPRPKKYGEEDDDDVEERGRLEVEVEGMGGVDLLAAIIVNSLNALPASEGDSITASAAGMSVLFHSDKLSLTSFLPALPGGENVRVCFPLEIGTARK